MHNDRGCRRVALESYCTDFASEGAQARAEWLAGLRLLADAAEVVFTEALASFDQAGDHGLLFGSASAGAWLRAGLHLAPGDASARVHLARQRHLLKRTLDAVLTGTVTYDQAQSVEKAVRPLPAHARPDAVELLTDLSEQTDAGTVRVAGRRLREVVDPDGSLADNERDFQRRHLTLSPLLDGMTSVDGLLDPEAAATVQAALAPLIMPTGPDDGRSAAQRRADALVEVAAVALRSEQLPVLSGAVAAVDVIVPWADLQPGRGALAGNGFLPGPSLARLLCDATVSRIVLGPDSLPLDVGRSSRLFTPAQRRALAVRDGGCRFPGCSRPPRHTDGHHVVPWLSGGPTDLANGMLLCRTHHRAVHEGGWRVVPEDQRVGGGGPVWFRGPRDQRIRSDPRAP